MKLFLALCMLAFGTACPAQTDTLSVLFTGDILLDRGVALQIKHTGAEWLFSGVDSLFHSNDAVIINLECPLTDVHTPVSKQYVFKAPTVLAQTLKKAGVSHACLANNHTMDQGTTGLNNTCSALTKAGIKYVGYGNGKERQTEPAIIDKQGIRVAVFNTTTLLIENWFYNEDGYGVCQQSAERLAEVIGKYKSEHPQDYVVVVVHWGVEFNSVQSFRQIEEAKTLVGAGADAIIGHHPHCIQPIKMYGKSPVFFSLGNFIFDQHNPLGKKSIAARLLFTKKNGLCYETIPIDIVNCRPEITTHQQHR